MRVLADTNLFIAYLLKPREDSFVALLMDAVAGGTITLLAPAALLDEINRTVRRKPSLIRLITKKRLERFLFLLKSVSEEIPPITETIPRITRDPKDDYLIVYAVVGEADCLVTGDKDLLVLKKIQTVSIVHAGEFRQILRNA